MTEQRREQMLRAALEVIVERGYADTRIADVAERAGTSPALVIYYFKTRDQLLTEAIALLRGPLVRRPAPRRLEAIPTAAGQLAELIAMTCLPDTDPAAAQRLAALARPVGAVAAQHRGRRGAAASSTSGGGRPSRTIVLAGQEARRVRAVDADDFAVTLSALLDGMAVQIALEDPDVAARARV